MDNFIFFSLICIRPIILSDLVTDQYLTHYWPILNSTKSDIVGTAHMQQGMNTSFTSDRFGCPNSAMNLNGGFTYVPAGVYFDSPEFTISVWIYPQSVGSWSRVIDFANGAPLDNIVLSQDSGLNRIPYTTIRNGTIIMGTVSSSVSLALKQWQFLTSTYNGTSLIMYINGVIKANLFFVFTLPTLNRTKNYIGKSNWNDSYSWSYLDDLRFYNRSLSQSEIIDLMNLNSKNYNFIKNMFYISNKCII